VSAISSRPAQRLLVVVAHPDDETFGCGSTLAHAAARGATATVVCATRGEAGTPTPGSVPEGVSLAEVREAELRAAASLLGVDRVEVLSWLDSDMEGEPAPGTLVAAPLEEVAAVIVELIEELRPTVIVTLDGTDGHRDHAHVRDATLLAVDRAAWSTERIYFQCLSRELMQEWIALMQQENPDSVYLGYEGLGTPEAELTTVIDSSAELDRRQQAIALHASQASPYEILPPDLRRRFLAVERLRRVRPPWTGGPVETELFPG
jgi:N-acetyl-1-D-myo-inositol-2-amino-2-deoxy-alpha-D-glucopyranoside deacetylase